MGVTPSVLIIDDDERTHLLLGDILETLSIDLHFVSNSDDAFNLLENFKPTVILLDLRLPAPSLPGWDIVPVLKGNPHTADIPIIIMSASGGEAIMRAIKAGADDFIEKPFSIKPLRNKVLRYIGMTES